MRKIATALLASSVLVLGATGSVSAQTEATPEQLVEFDAMLVDGEFRAPDVETSSARQAARFERLSSLKKSMLPKIQEMSLAGTL